MYVCKDIEIMKMHKSSNYENRQHTNISEIYLLVLIMTMIFLKQRAKDTLCILAPRLFISSIRLKLISSKAHQFQT